MYSDNTKVLVLAYGIGTDHKMTSFLKRLAKETVGDGTLRASVYIFLLEAGHS